MSVKDVSAYIKAQSPEVAKRLNQLRALFKQFSPETETISYNMPAYKIGKYHFYFSATKKHIGLYPGYRFPEIEKEILPYRGKGTKDSLHFPLNKPFPIELIKAYILLAGSK